MLLLAPISRWLRDVPIEDPLDRRNAPAVQVLLAFFALYVAINKLLFIWATTSGLWHRRPHLSFDVATDVVMIASAMVAFVMIRRGWFRPAVYLFVGVVLSLTSVGYALIDVKVVAFEAMPIMVVALGGLVMGQRTLWTIALIQVSGYLVCLASNLLDIEPQPEPALVAIGIIFSTVGNYLLIAFIVARSVDSLRSSLAESVEKSRRLEHEMAEREHTHEQLIHAQKMEVVGRVASGVAHDFDNVLGVILGYTARRERLADGGVAPLLDAMEGIEIAGERAALISRQLLGFSRNDVTRLETLNLREVMDDVIPMMRQLFGAHTRLIADLPPGPLWIEIDRSQLELSLLSIASNANDAMPEGGSFQVSMRQLDDMVEIVLSDTGEGIAAADIAKIFDPFYTTKPLGSGTGLGLSVVRDVMLSAGGDIHVQSQPGQGANFVMRVPVAASVEVAQPETSPANR